MLANGFQWVQAANAVRWMLGRYASMYGTESAVFEMLHGSTSVKNINSYTVHYLKGDTLHDELLSHD